MENNDETEQLEIDYIGGENIWNDGYLVSRGVRIMALTGYCKSDQNAVLAVRQKLCEQDFGNAKANQPIPLILDVGGGTAEYGWAQRAWVIDTYEWILKNVPRPHLDRLRGLMLGYSVDAIAEFDERSSVIDRALPKR